MTGRPSSQELADRVGMHECATCRRCATTYAIVHPFCPKCAVVARLQATVVARLQATEQALQQIVRQFDADEEGEYAPYYFVDIARRALEGAAE